MGINWKKQQPSLTKRQAHVLFLKGALNVVEKKYLPPANPEAMRHFLDGAQAVHSGYVTIGDPEGMREFIAKIEAGQWPPRMRGAQ